MVDLSALQYHIIVLDRSLRNCSCDQAFSFSQKQFWGWGVELWPQPLWGNKQKKTPQNTLSATPAKRSILTPTPPPLSFSLRKPPAMSRLLPPVTFLHHRVKSTIKASRDSRIRKRGPVHVKIPLVRSTLLFNNIRYCFCLKPYVKTRLYQADLEQEKAAHIRYISHKKRREYRVIIEAEQQVQ